jgi:hypothetical protein
LLGRDLDEDGNAGSTLGEVALDPGGVGSQPNIMASLLSLKRSQNDLESFEAPQNLLYHAERYKGKQHVHVDGPPTEQGGG